jgi:arylsulfatase A-like enzyme
MGVIRKPVDLIYSSMLGAALLLTTELVKSHRSNFWVGLNVQGWQGAVIAFIVYFATLFAIALAIDFSLRAVLRNQDALRYGIAIGIATALIALFLTRLIPVYSAPAAFATVALMMGLLTLSALSEYRGWTSHNGMIALVGAACAVSWIAMETLGTFYFINAERHIIVTVLPVAAAAIAFEIGFVVMLNTPARRRSAIPLVLIIFAGGGSYASFQLFARPIEAGSPNQPSLLLVTCDALRADYLSVYGGPVETPNFERIQQKGTTFDRAYALAPWTLPSVNALYGSQYPLGLTPGAPYEQWRREVTAYTFDEKQQTIAQRLSAQGYATALLTGNGLVGQAESTRRGFDFFVRLGHHLEGWTGRWAYVPYFRELLVRFAPNAADVRPVDTTRVLTAYARRFFESHRGQPVFLWLHYMDPHSPYDPPDLYRTDDGPWPLFCPRNPHWGTPQHGPDGSLELTQEEEAYVQSLYEDEIRYVDASIGEVLTTMDETSHNANAIVCLTADHGEEIWDHGKWGHGHSLYEEVIRVPLILSAPGIPMQRILEPISHIDLIPTLAALTQVGTDPNWQGQSLAPQLLDQAHTDRPAFARATNLLNPDEPLEMVAIQDYRLIHGLQSNNWQLFNRAEDPDQRNDVSSQDSGIFQALAYTLHLWNFVFPPAFSGDDTESNEEVLVELQALGYVN